MSVRSWLCATVVLAVLLGSVTAMAQGKNESPAGAPPDTSMAAMMEAMAKFGAPGPAHKFFEALTGNWSATVKMWMDPSAPPTESKGTARRETLLGGRWLKEEFQSEFMDQPFSGVLLIGHDNFRQRYITLWVDNMSTALMLAHGTVDSTGTIFTCIGTMDQPATGEKDKEFREVLRVTGPDQQVLEMYDTIPGQGLVKVMEITYTRIK